MIIKKTKEKQDSLPLGGKAVNGKKRKNTGPNKRAVITVTVVVIIFQ